MSKVGDILTQMASDVDALLGAGWNELKYVYDLEKNDIRTAHQGYGVGVGAGDSVAGPTRTVTIDQEFFVVLSYRFENRSSDSSQRSAISSLYSKMEVLDKNLFQTKLNLQATVLVVSAIGIDEPLITDDGVMYLVNRYTVKYRNATT